ncbi:hypothetical protein AGOR_G00212510 [Albula goreensis]|uniref:UPAR/Ly6 domain-containing protein n=1 Tax=Albula goreensis TaxID=1534307 RepID=A0A8T3CMH6_9TELE|nr:hypothetical protein AGOR_G00212510 [Albula goreensis]
MMKLLVALGLACALFSRAFSLQCCTAPEPCNPQTCLESQDMCASLAVGISTGGSSSDLQLRSCLESDLCLDGSFNNGMARVTVSAECCDSDSCNTEPATPLADNSPNGRQCFTCEGDLCNKTLDCQGPEDRCFSASLSGNNQTQMEKGCVSKSICDNAENPVLESLPISLNLTCCKGNFCNSAPRVGQSSFLLLFLLMLLPSIAFFR